MSVPKKLHKNFSGCWAGQGVAAGVLYPHVGPFDTLEDHQPFLFLQNIIFVGCLTGLAGKQHHNSHQKNSLKNSYSFHL